MSASFEFDALKELAKEIAALPATIRAEFKPTVVDGAERIQSRVASAYAAEGVESVGAGMRVEVSDEAGDISARVVNPSKLGHLYELGTVDRYDPTRKGAYRGRMPAKPTFIPIAQQERARVAEQLERDLSQLRLKTLDVR
jgi:hypothetical protein